ncbi:universal stress protein [Nocardioides sp. NPDC057767]|uniref:universal stress protein n=1 Tax=unclassified Nocardioides TaxID=2615069 RepID=UPI00367291B1
MTIIVGYMPGDAGERVLAGAVREARTRDSSLLVVNSSTGGAYADRGLVPDTELDALRRRLADQGLEVEVRQYAEAISVAETLVDEAERVSADLVVVGLRRRSRTGKFLLGSTAQTVLLRAHCDVLAIRIPTDD